LGTPRWHSEAIRRLVVADDVALAFAEVAGACGVLARAVARLSAHCDDPRRRRFEPLFAALVAWISSNILCGMPRGGTLDRKACKMQRLVRPSGKRSGPMAVTFH
jgi:hypothetical protein